MKQNAETGDTRGPQETNDGRLTMTSAGCRSARSARCANSERNKKTTNRDTHKKEKNERQQTKDSKKFEQQRLKWVPLLFVASTTPVNNNKPPHLIFLTLFAPQRAQNVAATRRDPTTLGTKHATQDQNGSGKKQ
jgi:hypothetical protein